jgi:hypothetical protein
MPKKMQNTHKKKRKPNVGTANLIKREKKMASARPNQQKLKSERRRFRFAVQRVFFSEK